MTGSKLSHIPSRGKSRSAREAMHSDLDMDVDIAEEGLIKTFFFINT